MYCTYIFGNSILVFSISILYTMLYYISCIVIINLDIILVIDIRYYIILVIIS